VGKKTSPNEREGGRKGQGKSVCRLPVGGYFGGGNFGEAQTRDKKRKKRSLSMGRRTTRGKIVKKQAKGVVVREGKGAGKSKAYGPSNMQGAIVSRGNSEK